MTLTLSGYDGCTITGITLSMKSNKSGGAGSFTAVAGSTTISSISKSTFNNSNWNGAWSTSYVDVTPTMTNNTYVIGVGEKVVLTIAATANSLYCQSFTITYEPAAEQPGQGGGETPEEPTPDPEPVYGVVDVLNLAFTGISGTDYGNWADKVDESGTRYLGQSAGGNDAIQLRSKNSNSGIVTDRSVGTVKKVTVKWNSNTASGRTLDVYGSNTAYDSASRLYKTETQGTKLGSIVYGTSTELVIEGEYEYIGLRSNDGAMYLDEIQIVWCVSENITAGTYLLLPGTFETEDCELYAIRFVNKNDGSEDWMQGYLSEKVVYFDYKGAENYTHMTFCVIENKEEYTTPDSKYPEIKTANVLDRDKWEVIKQNIIKESEELTHPGKLMAYNLVGERWEEIQNPTGLDRVEMANGIGYAYGVVSAEGAIEVYNVNGAVVARGNDTIDLRGLGRGVYIIRNGNQVRKVVR